MSEIKLKITKISFGRTVVLVSLAGLITGALLLVGLFALFQREFPDVSALADRHVQISYQGKGKPVKVSLNRTPHSGYVRYGEISKAAIGAVIVSEDWSFFSHEGFDAEQLKEAIKEDLAEGRFARGASTLTMQVVKNVFLSQEKSLWRKFKELILAIRLDRHVTKRKILETYFNMAEWGEGVYGIGAASRHYFGKHPSQLTPRESAFLAMLLPSPKKYSVSYRSKKLTPFANRMVRSILGKMAKARYITEEDRSIALSTPMSWEKDAVLDSPNSGTSESEDSGPDEEELPRELDLIPQNESE